MVSFCGKVARSRTKEQKVGMGPKDDRNRRSSRREKFLKFLGITIMNLAIGLNEFEQKGQGDKRGVKSDHSASEN